ncbi:MAG: AAA family ATPase [Candidatus Omnitrophica bacterium]|nr:AAA family ATPase [Candidatus Omnitrophota bacterium]
MYTEYWSIKDKPFENTPDPRFIYYSSKHEEALSRMLYCIREKKGAGMLTGDYGSGKTLLSRVLLKELKTERYTDVLIFNPVLSPIEFLKEIAYQLGQDSVPDNKVDIIHVLNGLLYENYTKGKDTIILIDEAQTIVSDEVFEELRLILNFQLNNAFLLTLILIGQPELVKKINKIPQLSQRIAIRYFLSSLEETETYEYIKHRLNVVGREKNIFDESALRLIFRVSRGIPRVVNNICDMSLLVGFGAKKELIDEVVVREVIRDMEDGHSKEANPTPLHRLY